MTEESTLVRQSERYTKNTQPSEIDNLRDDFRQQTNLYAEIPKKVAELEERLQAI